MYMSTKERFNDWLNDLQFYLKFTHQRRDMVDAYLQYLHVNPVNLGLDF